MGVFDDLGDVCYLCGVDVVVGVDVWCLGDW